MMLNYKPLSFTKSCTLSLVLLSPAVFAMPVVGTLEMTGGYSITETATTAHIDFGSFFTGDDTFTVTGATGDFSPALNQVGAITDLDLDLTGSPACVDCTVTNFYTVDAFSFDLLSLEITANDANNLNLAGIGSISAAGFENTAGTWSFTSDRAGDGLFSWSSSTVSASVPEPGSVALLLAGLAGLVTARRHQSSHNSSQ